MSSSLDDFVALVASKDGINDKAALSKIVADRFALVKDRSVYYCDDFAVRFSSSGGTNFGNTVLSLSNLQKVDRRPFFVCLVTPTKNILLLANSTFLKRISHSSQELRADNIRGSFNGSDIMREFETIKNQPENISRLFAIHEAIEFKENLVRLVSATNNIEPSGEKFAVSKEAAASIIQAPSRATKFVASAECCELKQELDERVERVRNEIILAALIENVNVRGRVIEYLIAGESNELRSQIIAALQANSGGIPPFKTDNKLGDYSREFEQFSTETDVKTKIMVLNSNPKAYNIDKMLQFLAKERSVFMFYFVGVSPTEIVNTVLVSMFQEDLLRATITLRHWAGRNSRGVTQLEGGAIKKLILEPDSTISAERAAVFLQNLLEL